MYTNAERLDTNPADLDWQTTGQTDYFINDLQIWEYEYTHIETKLTKLLQQHCVCVYIPVIVTNHSLENTLSQEINLLARTAVTELYTK